MKEKKYYRILTKYGKMKKTEIVSDCKEIKILKIRFIIFEEHIKKHKDWFGKYVIVHLETGLMAGYGNSKKSAIEMVKERLQEFPDAIKNEKVKLTKGGFEIPVNI